jgi:hypothetical protein
MAAIGAVKWGQREQLTPVGVPFTINTETGAIVKPDPGALSTVGWVSTSGSRSPLQDSVRFGGRCDYSNFRNADW